MKGLDWIFSLAEYIKSHRLEDKITLTFYGPIHEEDRDYFEAELRKYSFAEYKGVLQPSEIHQTLNDYDVMLLPTHYYTEGLPGSIIDAYISGIPVMNLSHLCGDKKGITLSLDLCYDISSEELTHHITESIRKAPHKETEDILNGVLNSKLSYAIMSKAGLSAHTPADRLKAKDIQALISIIKSFDIAINGTRGFDNAQVCAGGVSLDEINLNTMESKLQPNLYFAGEILDVDGKCGGYNLTWAFASGKLAGENQ
jgi:glycosyltransferase involved in cell wall biosynthesis